MADVIAMSGRWNNHLYMQLWQMLLPGWLGFYSHQGGCGVGRWNSQVSFTSILVLRWYAEPHPICVADGICQYFC